MKKLLLNILLVFSILYSQAQTATNFTCNDCLGTSHDLFTELDAGKVVVLCWVMPCGACIGPALTSYNVVQSYQASQPNRVFFYLVDDYGNTSCPAINSWGNTNNIPQSASSLRFSNSAINMTDYGATGMPKIVVVGGSTHTVFYNANNTVNATSLQNAINAALSATGISEASNQLTGITIQPNPARDNAEIKFHLSVPSKVILELYSMDGKLIAQENKGILHPGENKTELNTLNYATGMYLLKISTQDQSDYLNLIISH